MGPDAILVFCASIAGGLVFLAIIAMLIWLEARKKRLEHEEDMLALERGLPPPRGRRRAWLWLCVGLPIFIGCALAWGTFQLVGASINSGRDFTPLLITIWCIAGTVAVAAVIMGGLGLLADQRHAHRQAPAADLPRVHQPAGTISQGPKVSSEQIWKQERQ